MFYNQPPPQQPRVNFVPGGENVNNPPFAQRVPVQITTSGVFYSSTVQYGFTYRGGAAPSSWTAPPPVNNPPFAQNLPVIQKSGGLFYGQPYQYGSTSRGGATNVANPIPPSPATVYEGNDAIAATGANYTSGSAQILELFDGPVTAANAKQTQIVGYRATPGPGVSPSSQYQFSTLVLDSSFFGNPQTSSFALIAEAPDVLSATGANQTTSSAAITESPDIVQAYGFPNSVGVAAIIEGLDGISLQAISAGAVGSVVEGLDAVSGTAASAALSAAAITEGADIPGATGNITLTGSSAVLEGQDAVTGTIQGFGATIAAILEGSDPVSAHGATGSIGSSALREGLDAIAAQGALNLVGSAGILEGRDTPAGSGTTLLGSGVITESFDLVLAQGVIGIPGHAAISEPLDALFTFAVVGAAASGAISEPIDATLTYAYVGSNTALPWPSNVVTITFEQQQNLSPFGPTPYGEFFAHVGDVMSYGIDWTGWIANYWQAGELVTTSTIIRPSKPNGFQYACTTAGQSGNVEPAWPVTLGGSVLDGEAVWTCEAIDNTSLLTTVAGANWIGGGLGITQQFIVGQLTSAIINFGAATVGSDYVVSVPTSFANGEVKNGQLKFKVR